MIRVSYDGGTGLSVRGHAGSGPKGQDLICAAATALVLTLGESCLEKELRPGYAELKGGDPEIFRAVSRGFALLARMYPRFLRYECRGVRVIR